MGSRTELQDSIVTASPKAKESEPLSPKTSIPPYHTVSKEPDMESALSALKQGDYLIQYAMQALAGGGRYGGTEETGGKGKRLQRRKMDMEVPAASPLPPEFPRVVDMITCGSTQYPLVGRWTRSSVNVVAEEISPDGEKGGLTDEEADLTIHFHFQRISRIPVHERSERENQCWDSLCRLIDMRGYRSMNALTLSLLGEIVSVTPRAVRVNWFGGGTQEFDFADVPGVFASATKGMTVHAKIRRLAPGTVEWIDCSLSPHLRSDKEFLADPTSQLSGLEVFPDADWPTLKSDRDDG